MIHRNLNPGNWATWPCQHLTTPPTRQNLYRVLGWVMRLKRDNKTHSQQLMWIHGQHHTKPKKERKKKTHLLFNDYSHELCAKHGQHPLTLVGTSLVTIGAMLLNTRYGWVSMTMRSERGRNSAQEMAQKSSWMLMNSLLHAPVPVMAQIILCTSRWLWVLLIRMEIEGQGWPWKQRQGKAMMANTPDIPEWKQQMAQLNRVCRDSSVSKEIG